MAYRHTARRLISAVAQCGVMGLVAMMAGNAVPVAASAEIVDVKNTFGNRYKYFPFPQNCTSRLAFTNMPAGFRIERPHKVYNNATRKWVLWAHYEGSGYTVAQALVATSNTECGPFKIVKTFRPLGYEIRDDFLYKDDDGTAYFMAASRKNRGANDTMAIFRLTRDYLDVDADAGVTWAFENAYREAPVVMKKGSVYFLLTSQAAGWFPSQGAYATSTSMLGPWSPLANLGSPATFGGQNAGPIVYKGTSSTANILVMDHLGGAVLRNDGLLFLPVLLDDVKRTATLDWYSNWSVNTVTGTLTLPSTDSIAAGRPATASTTASTSSPQNANDRDYFTKWEGSGTIWPAWWQVDLQSPRHMSEIQITWPNTKGSEALYQYQLQFSDNGRTWRTIDRTDNPLYGFTVDQIDETARYLRIRLVNAKLHNNPNNWYRPGMWNVRVLP
jgi:hypothetical protein